MDLSGLPVPVVLVLGELGAVGLSVTLGVLLGADWRERHPRRPTPAPPKTAAGAGIGSDPVPAASKPYGRHALLEGTDARVQRADSVEQVIQISH